MARVDLGGVAKQLATAEDITAIGNIVGEACEQALPFGSLAYAVFEPRVTERPCIVVRSTESAPDWIARRFPGMMLAIERDVGGLQVALSERHAYDGYEKFPIETIKDTEVLNEHWRVYRADQQLVAPMWHAGVPVGYFTISRSAKEARISPEDLWFLDERALEGIAALKDGQLFNTLDALSQVFPNPAYLFESRGRLQRMSDEGAVRLGVAAAKLGSARLIRGSHALLELSACGSAMIQDPAHDGEGRLRATGGLRQSERLAVRRFGEATVRTHLHRVYVKLGVHGRAELTFALLRGLR
jgi:hypothetical protein